MGKSAPLPAPDDWGWNAYKLYIRGCRNWAAIARIVEKDYRTVKRVVSGLITLHASTPEDVTETREQVLAELAEVKKTAWELYGRVRDENNVKIGALKIVKDTIMHIASIEGIDEQHVAVGVSGSVGYTPLPIFGNELAAIIGGTVSEDDDEEVDEDDVSPTS